LDYYWSKSNPIFPNNNLEEVAHEGLENHTLS